MTKGNNRRNRQIMQKKQGEWTFAMTSDRAAPAAFRFYQHVPKNTRWKLLKAISHSSSLCVGLRTEALPPGFNYTHLPITHRKWERRINYYYTQNHKLQAWSLSVTSLICSVHVVPFPYFFPLEIPSDTFLVTPSIQILSLQNSAERRKTISLTVALQS